MVSNNVQAMAKEQDQKNNLRVQGYGLPRPTTHIKEPEVIMKLFVFPNTDHPHIQFSAQMAIKHLVEDIGEVLNEPQGQQALQFGIQVIQLSQVGDTPSQTYPCVDDFPEQLVIIRVR